MKVLLLNGPPRAGKDTIGRMLQREIPGSELFKFGEALKEMTHRAILGHRAPADALEDRKDDPERGPEKGVTWRQAYIAMSEKFVKPLFGAGWFGKELAHSISWWASYPGARLAIVTDSGFREEAAALRDAGHELARLVIWRRGCSFNGDSRSIWNGAGLIPDGLDWSLGNDGNCLTKLETVVGRVANRVKDWIAS